MTEAYEIIEHSYDVVMRRRRRDARCLGMAA
jgi:hypothetical protein